MHLPAELNAKTFSVSLSRGIINKLNDEELEAVIAHELTHIRNRDVRLLIISIVFVGIFALSLRIHVQINAVWQVWEKVRKKVQEYDYCCLYSHLLVI